MTVPDPIWQWLRGDMSEQVFEQWVYDNFPLLEDSLGPELAIEFVEQDYRWNGRGTRELRERLEARLPPRGCECASMRDRTRVPLGADSCDYVAAKLEEQKSLTRWLTLYRCRACGQQWYGGCDTVGDDFYFERMTPAQAEAILERGEWPSTFDGWIHLWPEEVQGARQVCFAGELQLEAAQPA